jgi:hypothetical protein
MKKYIKTVAGQKFAYYLLAETFCDIRSGIKLDHDGLYQLAECVINITQNTLVKDRHSTLESLVENSIAEQIKVIDLDIEYIKISDVIHVADKVTFSPGGDYAQFQRRNGNIIITASNNVKQKLFLVSVEAPRGSGKTTMLRKFYDRTEAGVEYIQRYYVVPSMTEGDYFTSEWSINIQPLSYLKESILKYRGRSNNCATKISFFFDEISPKDQDEMIQLLQTSYPNTKIIAYSARTPK